MQRITKIRTSKLSPGVYFGLIEYSTSTVSRYGSKRTGKRSPRVNPVPPIPPDPPEETYNVFFTEATSGEGGEYFVYEDGSLIFPEI